MVMVMLYDVLYSKGGGRGGGVILRELNKMKPKLEVCDIMRHHRHGIGTERFHGAIA